MQVTTPHDKKTVLFFNDKSFDLNVEDGKSVFAFLSLTQTRGS